MTAVQALFLVGLTTVMIGILAFASVVVLGALRGDDGAIIDGRLVRRMLRDPVERTEVDRWVFYAHRISGFAIFAFLCLHVLDVSLYAASQRLYGQEHRIYGNAAMRLLECGLLLAILFHTFNGLRVLSLDLADLNQIWSRRLLSTALIATLVLGVAGSVVILKPVIS